MAMGLASELEYHLLLAKDLRFLENEDHDRAQSQVVEVKRMLAGLIRKIDAERG
jgi:four helix bundle protein